MTQTRVTGHLVVRRGQTGESLDGLNGKSYEVDDSVCVIADDVAVESLGGILGGAPSGCTEETVNVLIESALWDEDDIAATGRKLGINTDARYRFERGVDPDYMMPGLEYATRMVLDLCGGEPSQAIQAGKVPDSTNIVEFPYSEVKRLSGVDVSPAEINVTLKALGFWMSGSGDTVKVAAPSWRPDIEGKADLVEEVVRIIGLDRVSFTPLPRTGTVGQKVLTTGQIRRNKSRRALAARGLNEAVTWSFISREQAELFGGGGEALALANPISHEMTDMRPSLLPGPADRRPAQRGSRFRRCRAF